jgi:hypothetical protein
MVVCFRDNARDDAALLGHAQALLGAGLFNAIEIFFCPVHVGVSPFRG